MTPFKGTSKLPNFYRRSFGAGWALVGDAAYHRDPLAGMGIGDAFPSAQLIADALIKGLGGETTVLDSALSAHQAAFRDRTMPIFDYTVKAASLREPASAIPIYERIGQSDEETVQFVDVLAGNIPAKNVFNPKTAAAARATRSVPIIGRLNDDPVENGMAKSLARPGGNVSGVYGLAEELIPKRLSLFKEVVPSALRVGVLLRDDWPTAKQDWRTGEAAAKQKQTCPGFLQTQIWPSRSKLIEVVLGRYSRTAASTATSSVRQPVSWCVNAEERRKPAGKSNCASLDSSDSWDKVTTSAEKRNDSGRK